MPARGELIARRQATAGADRGAARCRPASCRARAPRRARSRAARDRAARRSRPTAASFSSVSVEVGAGHPSPVDEQLDAVARHAVGARQRGHRPGVLAAHAERRLTRRQHRDRRRRLQHRGRRPRRLRQAGVRSCRSPPTLRGCSPTRTTCRPPARPWRSGTPNASRIVAATSAPSSSAASDANHTPSRNTGATSAATCNARRDLPTPPGPVNVTNRSCATSAASSFTSSARPMKLVRCTGRLPGSSSSVRSGGNSSVPSCQMSIGLPEVAAGDARRDCAASGPARDRR